MQLITNYRQFKFNEKFGHVFLIYYSCMVYVVLLRLLPGKFVLKVLDLIILVRFHLKALRLFVSLYFITPISLNCTVEIKQEMFLKLFLAFTYNW